MTDLFISYRSSDRPWAKRLFDDLQARFPTIKIAWDRDPTSLPPDTKWRDWIENNAENATHFAVLWSEAAKASDEVGPEIQAFRQNVKAKPTAPSGARRKFFYIPLEGKYGWVEPVQGFAELRTAYSPDAPDRGICNLELAPHREEWRRMIGIIGRTALEAEATQPITLALLVTTTNNLKLLDSVFEAGNIYPSPTLQEYLDSIGLTLADAKARYDETAYSWRPFGTTKTVVDLMEDAREITNRELKPPHLFHWKPIDFIESFLAAAKVGQHAIQQLVEHLANGPSVVVTDPISLFNPVVATTFNRLKEYAKKPHSVILSISPHELSAASRLYECLLNNGTLLEHHLRPPIPMTEVFALCGINVQHAMDIERLIRSGLGYYSVQKTGAVSKPLYSPGA